MQRCTCYCTAGSYDIPRLLHTLQKRMTQLHRDVIHTHIKKEVEGTRSDIYYFSYGVVVCWGFSEEEEQGILLSIKEFERDPVVKPELDEFLFTYAKKRKIEGDVILLDSRDPLTKLAISHGIAQSVKLSLFEERIQKTIDHTRHLPNDLAEKGRIFLSRNEISRKMGQLFIERNFINLNSEIFDTPEFFWDHPEFELYYRSMAYYLDLNKRTEVLNRRLNVVHELFEMLSNAQTSQLTVRLEWGIIFLILIEVVIALLRDLFHVI